MPIPDFIADLRAKIGTDPLWLIGCTAVVTRTVGDELQVLMVRRADDGRWTPVTGIVDPGEHPELAAVRETLEESSITARVVRLAQVGVTRFVEYTNGDRTQYLDLSYRCEYVSGEPYPADGENTDAQWFGVEQLPAMSASMRARVDAALSSEIAPRTVLREDDL